MLLANGDLDLLMSKTCSRVGLPASLVCSRDLKGVKGMLVQVSAADKDRLRFLLKKVQ